MTVFVQIFIDQVPDVPALLRITSSTSRPMQCRPTGRRKECLMGLPSSFVYDKENSFIFWLEFGTEEEAAIFKLTYL